MKQKEDVWLETVEEYVTLILHANLLKQSSSIQDCQYPVSDIYHQLTIRNHQIVKTLSTASAALILQNNNNSNFDTP